VDGVGIHNVEIGKALILEVTDTSATISVEVKIDYTANVSYLNDDERIWAGNALESVHADLTAEVEC